MERLGSVLEASHPKNSILQTDCPDPKSDCPDCPDTSGQSRPLSLLFLLISKQDTDSNVQEDPEARYKRAPKVQEDPETNSPQKKIQEQGRQATELDLAIISTWSGGLTNSYL